MHVQLLVSFNKETKLESFDLFCIEDLKHAVAGLFPKTFNNNPIVYFDDEGDKIKLTCKPEFDEAMNFASKNGHFFSVIVEEQCSSELPSAPAPAAVPEDVNPLQNVLSSFQNIFNSSPLVNNLFQNANLESNLMRMVEEGNLENVFGSLKKDLSPILENFAPALENFAPVVQNLADEVNQAVPDMLEKIQKEMQKFEQPEQAKEVEMKKMVKPVVTHNAICDKCDKYITGIRYKCLTCPDFDHCSACEGPNSGHDEDHVFAKLYTPSQRLSPVFQKAPEHGRGGRRGHCGRRKQRVVKLEADVLLLQQQVQQLLSKKAAEKEAPVPVVEQPEDVQPEAIVENEELELCVEDVVVEDVEDVEEPKISEATQTMLKSLNEMGFNDNEQNLAVLIAHNYDLPAALESMFSA